MQEVASPEIAEAAPLFPATGRLEPVTATKQL